MVNTNWKLTWPRVSFEESQPAKDCLHWVAMWAGLYGIALITLIDVASRSPVWVAPLPRQSCTVEEGRDGEELQACNSYVSSALDWGMWSAPSGFLLLDFCTWQTAAWTCGNFSSKWLCQGVFIMGTEMKEDTCTLSLYVCTTVSRLCAQYSAAHCWDLFLSPSRTTTTLLFNSAN